MRAFRNWLVHGAAGLACLVPALVDGAVPVPKVSPRTFTGGSALVVVTGSFQVKDRISLTLPASISDGEMTWLQYGSSGSALPNALVTISLDEIGVNVARGRPTATAGGHDCKGQIDVSPTLIKGDVSCKDVVSYDPRTGQMGKVTIEISFTAAS